MRDSDHIMNNLVEEWRKGFAIRNADYSSAEFEPHRFLGVRGQFADIWRKIWKLRKAFWDGQALTGEQPREILMDLIGHCFLTIACLDREAWEARQAMVPRCKPGCEEGHTYARGCIEFQDRAEDKTRATPAIVAIRQRRGGVLDGEEAKS